MILKSEEEIDQMRASALLVSKTLSMVAGELRAGISTLLLDKL
jgi:methionyl aminopeptidase